MNSLHNVTEVISKTEFFMKELKEFLRYKQSMDVDRSIKIHADTVDIMISEIDKVLDAIH